MKTYVALLRGINVGGNNKVSMASLKTLFESLGFGNVRTYINSGNVIFDSDSSDKKELNKRIESHLAKEFGFEIRCVLRDSENIKKLVLGIPKEWGNDTDQKSDVLFLWDEYDSKTSISLIKTNPDVDTLIYIDGAILWHIERKNYTKSGMNRFIGTIIYKNMTARNVNTVRKLAELMKPA